MSGMDPRFEKALKQLIAASNGRVSIGESFRSEAAQKAEFLRRYAPGASGNKNDRTYNGQKWHLKNPRDAPLASPGGSMHSIGLAADLKGDLAWVQANAARFGLKTFKDVNNEPWHVQLAALPNSRQEYEKSRYYIPYGSAAANSALAGGVGGATQSTATPTQQAAQSVPKGPTLVGKEERELFQKYLSTLAPDQQSKIIEELKQSRTLGEVGAYMAGAPPEVNRYIKYLGTLDAAGQYGEKSLLAAPDPAGSARMTDLLKSLGVSYPNAPNPTPALLAFLNGIGLNMSTAEDVKRRAIERIGASTSDAMAEIDRTAGRAKQNITADLVRRNVLSSGESNTRYARQAEDVGKAQSDVQKTAANAADSAETAFKQAQDLARQQALDRILGAEQQQSTERAASAANVDATNASSQAADQAAAQQKAAQDAALKAQQDEIARAASNGVVV